MFPTLDASHHAILTAMLAPALLMTATASLLVSANARLRILADLTSRAAIGLNTVLMLVRLPVMIILLVASQERMPIKKKARSPGLSLQH